MRCDQDILKNYSKMEMDEITEVSRKENHGRSVSNLNCGPARRENESCENSPVVSKVNDFDNPPKEFSPSLGLDSSVHFSNSVFPRAKGLALETESVGDVSVIGIVKNGEDSFVRSSRAAASYKDVVFRSDIESSAGILETELLREECELEEKELRLLRKRLELRKRSLAFDNRQNHVTTSCVDSAALRTVSVLPEGKVPGDSVLEVQESLKSLMIRMKITEVRDKEV